MAMKSILERILARLARKTLSRYRPRVVGITGSVGKTSAKEAIFCVLQKRFRVRRSEKNYNTEIGVPLTILGIPHYGRNVFGWLWGFAKSLFYILFFNYNYPEILILEMGADHPGDIAHLAALAPPFAGVITAIGDIPVHVEFFESPAELAREKTNLIRVLPASGFAVLNGDDPAIVGMKKETRARVVSYGFGEESGVRVTEYELHADPDKGETGISFKFKHGGSLVPVRLSGAFGKPQAYSAAAAAAVGLSLNMNFADIASALAAYEPPSGRLKLLRGNKHSWILDDTYNSSPVAARASLDVLRSFNARRRIAVLGDMLELGRFTEEAHRKLGAEVSEAADYFFAVGERMKFAVEEAKPRLGQSFHSQDRIFWFADSREAGAKLEALLEPGDVVLVKGSQGMRMERVVEEIMAEPERAGELLVRQTVDWKGRV